MIDCSKAFHHTSLPMTEPAIEPAEAKEPAEPEPVPPQFKVERKIEGTKEQPIISYQRVRAPPLRADAVDFVSAHLGRAAAVVQVAESADSRIVAREQG